MTNTKIRGVLFAAWFSGFLIGSHQRLLAAEAPYYEGKTLRIIVSSGAGGGTDSAARLVSRFISKYIPGHPKIIVQNMSGGGGTIANNYFASEVKPDGLTIMQDSSSGVVNFARGGSTVKYDPRKFKRHRRRRPSRQPAHDPKRRRGRDFTNRSAKPVVVGDTDGIRTWIAMTVWGAEYLGWNLRWIYGYPGSRELQLAIRQGEIDMWSTQNAKLVKDLQSEGVVQIVCTDEDQRREDFPDVPSFFELLGAKKPTGLVLAGVPGLVWRTGAG